MNSDQQAKFDRIVNFVRGLVPNQQQFPPKFLQQSPQPYSNRFYLSQNLPTIEKFVQDLLADPEFKLLQLGSWLETTDGEIISEAVELVIPPIYRSEYKFVVKGLKLAAEAQRKEGRRAAGRIALSVVVGGLVAFFVISMNQETIKNVAKTK